MCWQKCKQHQVVERVASVKCHSPAKLICNFGNMADFHRHILIKYATLPSSCGGSPLLLSLHCPGPVD